MGKAKTEAGAAPVERLAVSLRLMETADRQAKGLVNFLVQPVPRSSDCYHALLLVSVRCLSVQVCSFCLFVVLFVLRNCLCNFHNSFILVDKYYSPQIV